MNAGHYSESCLCDHLRNKDNLGITRTATPVPRPIQYTEIDLRNKTTSELRTVFHSPLGVPNCQVPLYKDISDIEVFKVISSNLVQLFQNGL